MCNNYVSLIMPVYNTNRELLETCIESIRNQTCDHWNLWIIDDGSVSETAKFCDTFAMTGKINVIHQKNAGVSAARNAGTRRADGEYIMYIDSDDVLAPYTIEDALHFAEETDADIVFGGVCKIRSQAEFSKYSRLQGKFAITEYSKDDLRRRILGSNVKGLSDIQEVGYVGRGPWAKLIKKELAIEVPFPMEYPIGEDLIWNLRLLNKSRNSIVANSIWYGYVVYQSSAISKYYGNREDIVARWYSTIQNENREYFIKNKSVQGQLLARELYSLIQYDILSLNNRKSIIEKNHQAAMMLSRTPWSILNDKSYCKELSKSQKLLLICCRMSLGASAVSLYVKTKKALR